MIKNFDHIRLTLFLLLFSFVVSLSGCVTTETTYFTEHSRKTENKDYEIISILLKNGQEIPVKGMNPKFIQDNNKTFTAIVYYLSDTTFISEGVKNIKYSEKRIEFKDIESAKVEITNVNIAVTLVLIFSPLILYGLYYLAILLAFAIGGTMH